MINNAIHYKIGAVILILAVACGCARPGGSNNAELIAIDSLLYQNRVLQAREMLQRMNREYMNDEDLAYHTLLSVQADVENKTASGDADPMGQTVKHYKNSGDHEKYARALLYQGGAYGAAGELDKAISCLRKAEDVAASDDLKNRARAKMMMGELNHSQVAPRNTARHWNSSGKSMTDITRSSA